MCLFYIYIQGVRKVKQIGKECMKKGRQEYPKFQLLYRNITYSSLEKDSIHT